MSEKDEDDDDGSEDDCTCFTAQRLKLWACDTALCFKKPFKIANGTYSKDEEE